MRQLISLLLLLLPVGSVLAAPNLPAAPTRYFNDYTGTIRPDTVAALNAKLEQFEKETSSQVVVAMFSRMPANTSLEEYANQLFRAWKIGQTEKDNGILLLVFKDDRKLRIEVGYGLEGVLPDALANQIISRELVPRFKQADFDGGLSAGVEAILSATRGEYKGSGSTVAGRSNRNVAPFIPFVIPVFFLLFFAIFAGAMLRMAKRGTLYHHRRRNYWDPVWTSGGSGWGGDGGGGFSGDFSGGGGSSGGGGASGSW